MEKIFWELFNSNSVVHMPYKKPVLEICTSFENSNIVVFHVIFKSAQWELIFAGSFITTGYHVAVCFIIV